MGEVQAGHLLVSDLGVEPDQLGVGQLVDDRQSVAHGRQQDVPTRLVRLGLEREPDPSDDTVRHAIHGNLCRCTGYQSIVTSIREGAAVVRGEPPRTWTEAHEAPRPDPGVAT